MVLDGEEEGDRGEFGSEVVGEICAVDETDPLRGEWKTPWSLLSVGLFSLVGWLVCSSEEWWLARRKSDLIDLDAFFSGEGLCVLLTVPLVLVLTIG